jgi:16S rRNA (uracil1498-N3)-methyltransferase
VPAIHEAVPLAEALSASSVLLYERHDGQRLSALEPPASVVIGPEGGFAPDELAAAERAGATLASLGPRILRSETVAVAAAAVILSRTGDFA